MTGHGSAGHRPAQPKGAALISAGVVLAQTARGAVATGATLAAYAALASAVGLFLRQHYAAPLVTSNLNVSGSAWIMSRWWTRGGVFAFGDFVFFGSTGSLTLNAPIVDIKR